MCGSRGEWGRVGEFERKREPCRLTKNDWKTRLHRRADRSRDSHSSVAGLAQLVEHLICNQRVGGSSPSAGTIKNKDLRRFLFPRSSEKSLWGSIWGSSSENCEFLQSKSGSAASRMPACFVMPARSKKNVKSDAANRELRSRLQIYAAGDRPRPRYRSGGRHHRPPA